MRKRRHWTVWLVYAIIVTGLVSTTTLSRYMTTISGRATATIASFVFPKDTGFNLDISSLTTPNTSKVFNFSVVNYDGDAISEVSQKYEIVITTKTDKLPLTFTLADNDTSSNTVNIAGDAGTLVTMTGSTENSVPSVTTSEDNNTTSYTYTGGTLGCIHKTKHNYKLTVAWPEDKNDAKYAGLSDTVTVTVKSEQISPSQS